MYICGFVEAKSCTPRKACSSGCTTGQTFPGLSAVVFLSVGHYPCYGSPDFSIIKSFSALVFPLGFFQGYLPKNIGVYVCLIWFPCLCFAACLVDYSVVL
jgi:hypothetical protein